MRFREIETVYRQGLARYGGVDPGLFDRRGTTIAPVADRTGLKTASAYEIGEHTLIFCDPEVAGVVGSLASSTDSFPSDRLAGWGTEHGFTYVGAGWCHLADQSMVTDLPPPPDATPVILDRDNADDKALIAGLVEVTDPDEADEADLDLENLDPFILGLLDQDGRIGAYASEKSSEHDAEFFADIAILTRSDMRGMGWGRAAVSILCGHIFDRARLPLYRCSQDNTGSRRLALSLGFEQVVALAAIRGSDSGD
jgi:RimJ/RimL family protein N-acetyltransferase